MARGKNYTTKNAYRNLARIEEAAEKRAEEIAQYIINYIRLNGPIDEHRPSTHRGVHLRDSYYARQDPATGDWVIRSRRRYWAYVEFGTRRMSAAVRRKNRHVRPAIEAARRRFGA